MQRAGGLQYETCGTGEAVLCIHGAIVADSFVPLMSEPALAGYRLIRYRRRGYGSSDPPAGVPTIEGQANDARALLGFLGVERSHVVAHSGGGPIAVQLALDAPEVVWSLVLLEPVLQTAAWAAAFHELITPLIELHRAGESDKAVDRWMTPGAGSDWRQRLEQQIPNVGKQADADAAGTFEYDLEAIRQWTFETVGPSRITQPVLDVVSSSNVAARQPLTDMLHAAVPQAELVTIPDADHSLHMTQPAVLARVIAAFLSRHPVDDNRNAA